MAAEEVSIERLTLSRRQYKAAVTRKINKIERYLAEHDKEKLVPEVEGLKDTFSKFENVHDRIQSLIEDFDESEKNDKYFYDVQATYIEVIKKARSWLESGSRDSSHASHISAEAMGLVNLPRLELKPFDGDPLKYHRFMATFDQAVVKYVADDSARLLHLLQFSQGEALSAIQSCTLLDGSEGYKRARDILHNRFGNEHLVMNSVVTQIRQARPARSGEELQRLVDGLSSGLATLKQLDRIREVDSQTLVLEVVNKVPNYIRNRWKKYAVDAKRDEGNYPGFNDLVKFLEKEVDEATDPVYGKPYVKVNESRESVKPKNQNFRTSTASSFAMKGFCRPPCVVCGQDHKIIYCSRFKEMQPRERVHLVHDKDLCENCLLGNHNTLNCRNSSTCTVPCCGKRHSKFLHISSPARVSVSNANIGSLSSASNPSVYMPVSTVKVNGNRNATVLLDSASTHTFCTQELVHSLGLQGESTKYSLSTLSKTNEKVTSQVVNFDIVSTDGSETLKLKDVLVVDKIPVQSPPVNVSMFKHLDGLSFTGNGHEVHILIGQDNAEALVPLDVKKGKKGEPFAVKTILGWTLYGATSLINSVSNYVVTHFVTARAEINHDIDVLWNLDNEGIDHITWSVNDHKVVDLWNKECKLVNGHYELPIPWKEQAYVPNNYSVASVRLKSTRKSLAKRDLYEPYNAEMSKLLHKGYAEPVPQKALLPDTKIWYLPHQAVISEKPGKLRVVFDCAAKYNGESLNDKCMQGPNLTNKLLNVLLRFRQHPYAVIADIEAMYYQVLIPEKDRNALRFLWYDETGEEVQYRMTRHVFGGIWCGSSSTFALRQVLIEYPEVDHMVSDTVMQSFYVYDCLKSLPEREQVMVLIEKTVELLSNGGFHLTKFVLNDMELLEQIPEDERAKEVKLVQENIGSKVLGINWDVKNDAFKFESSLHHSERSATSRRKMLSSLSSVYDPLGLLNPLLVKGKLIFQEATQSKVSWDEEIAPSLQRKWTNWIASLQTISDVRIPRCIKPSVF